MGSNYVKLLVMQIISFFIMYFVMFTNVAESAHIHLNIMRLYMAILMVAPMTIVMLSLMWKMFTNKKANIAIIAASIAVFITTIILMREQAFIGDKQYMRAMIPHHSSAILTSEEADIKDPEVKKLSEEIIKAQKEEIALMKQLLKKVGE